MYVAFTDGAETKGSFFFCVKVPLVTRYVGGRLVQPASPVDRQKAMDSMIAVLKLLRPLKASMRKYFSFKFCKGPATSRCSAATEGQALL